MAVLTKYKLMGTRIEVAIERKKQSHSEKANGKGRGRLVVIEPSSSI